MFGTELLVTRGVMKREWYYYINTDSDKLIYGTAVKGVAKDIFPKGEEPYSEYRKDEKIHALLSIGSINARMVTSVLITTAINKGLVELTRHVKDMAGIKYDINLI